MAAKKGAKRTGKKATSPKSPKPPIAKVPKPAIEQKPASPVPAEEPPNKGGRPSVYTAEIAQRVAERLADGKTLTAICKADPNLPHASTIRRWALDADHEFCAIYTRARELGFHVWADETIDIADDGSRDTHMVTGKDGFNREEVNHDHIRRSHLRVETRKWMIAKVLAKIYGDKLALTDPDGGRLFVELVQFRAKDGDA